MGSPNNLIYLCANCYALLALIQSCAWSVICLVLPSSVRVPQEPPPYHVLIARQRQRRRRSVESEASFTSDTLSELVHDDMSNEDSDDAEQPLSPHKKDRRLNVPFTDSSFRRPSMKPFIRASEAAIPSMDDFRRLGQVTMEYSTKPIMKATRPSFAACRRFSIAAVNQFTPGAESSADDDDDECFANTQTPLSTSTDGSLHETLTDDGTSNENAEDESRPRKDRRVSVPLTGSSFQRPSMKPLIRASEAAIPTLDSIRQMGQVTMNYSTKPIMNAARPSLAACRRFSVATINQLTPGTESHMNNEEDGYFPPQPFSSMCVEEVDYQQPAHEDDAAPIEILAREILIEVDEVQAIETPKTTKGMYMRPKYKHIRRGFVRVGEALYVAKKLT